MTNDIAIKVENISKKYQIGENKTYPTLRDKLMELPNRLFKGPKKNKEFWALKDVSFEVKKGEVVGIIGRNGAGKSTMLKILARITEPTSGKITMYGRVASMLEVGTGFNPELTGRENIYLNGAIIGMKKVEIEQKFSDIVAFSGVEKFLDTPVKHYSSGMYVRLAFAVSAHLDADILLVDEVLAVGDAEFQKKCLGKMSDLAKSGRTVIFVSHNLAVLNAVCSNAILLSSGTLSHYGSIKKISDEYLNIKRLTSEVKNVNNSDYISSIQFSLLNHANEKTNTYYDDESIVVHLSIDYKQFIDNLQIGLVIRNSLGINIGGNSTRTLNKTPFSHRQTDFTFSLDHLNLMPGIYSLSFWFGDKAIDHVYTSDVLTFQVVQSKKNYPNISVGSIFILTNWRAT